MTKSAARSLFEEAFKESETLRNLFRDLDDTFVAAGAGDGPTLATSRDLLEELQTHLEKHFEIEERGGYLAEALQAAPRFTKKAETLKDQHPEFRTQLTELIELTSTEDDPRAAFQELLEKFHAFTNALWQHESAENEILQRAFEEDVAAAD